MRPASPATTKKRSVSTSSGTSKLRVEPYTIPAADLGPENPLPFFRAVDEDLVVDFEANHVPLEEREGLGKHIGIRVLPYRMQDGYNRRKRPRSFFSVVLENEFLKVRVLPEVGGLVTSIVHKPLDRELLYCNPVFQPGNLAIRNAWVSGGIEWNTPRLGHHCLTCSPMHAARVVGCGGEPVLRLYAWERVYGFPYQIDLHLPDRSPFLFAHVRLINPHSEEMPMYWWTNIGVPEYPGGRVICPADSAYKGFTVMDSPVIDGLDHSYATRVQGSYDLFFRIPRDRRPWIAIVDREGAGLIHTSTRRLLGRKMFAWGMTPGGRRWNEHLSVSDSPFQEIQAGLAYTQMHTVLMPAQTKWSWTEAFGYFESSPKTTHSVNWNAACEECNRILDEHIPEATVDEFHTSAEGMAVRMPEEILFAGLGWGALDRKRSASTGATVTVPEELPFPDSDLGEDQAPWLALLESGVLPERDPREEPGHYVTHDSWRELLERSTSDRRGDHWLAWYHLGVMRMERGDSEGARQAWETSIQRAGNGWALRCLAVLEIRSGNDELARQLLSSAWEANPTVAAIAAEYGALLLRLGRYDELCTLVSGLPDVVRNHERLLLLSAEVALYDNQFGHVEAILGREFGTIKEGEVTLTDIWFRMWEKRISLAEGVAVDDSLRERVRRECPPPAEIDFRMSVPGGAGYTPPQAQE